ncbi:hypothetical protein BC829DRAFT_130022 [Chytridium lagenaria]|nr:hypothetical protein BC829DRAFT_130022 [Chytridium lagenaria]
MKPIQKNDTLCRRIFTDPNAFYTHLGEDHVGRRRTQNLTLWCAWLGCPHGPVAFGKRDHIVSHCRAHVNHKPHACELCPCHFKWPHDLKKHMKNAHGIDMGSVNAKCRRGRVVGLYRHHLLWGVRR